MHLSYNGISLEVLTLDRVERRNVLTPDGADILYVEWGISCSAVYHPAVVGAYGGNAGRQMGGTSVTISPGLRNPPVRTPSPVGVDPLFPAISQPGPENALITDRELMARLSVPRRPLLIWAYDTDGTTPLYWLVSPLRKQGGFLPRDAYNGPLVQAQVVTAAFGEGTAFGVQLEIKTWTPPCPSGSDRLILSHRWQMAHGHDANYYLARTITGEIWFHGGLKDEFANRPDLIARQLFHPIPLGFKRTLGPLTRSPDGLVVRYSFVDTDQKVVFDPGRSGATNIAISENVTYTAPFQGIEERMNAFRDAALAAGLMMVNPLAGHLAAMRAVANRA